MLKHIFYRVILIVPLLIGISLVTFCIIKLSPGDALSASLSLNPEVSSADIAEVRKLYHFDKPVIVQYFYWLKRMVVLDFGTSLIDHVPVMEKIITALPATLLLNVLSLIIVLIVGIPLGIYQAIYADSAVDRISTLFIFLAFSMPSFWLSLLLIYFFGFQLEWLPISGLFPWYIEGAGFWEKFIVVARHSMLPVIATSFSGFAGIARYMRMSMIEVLSKEYITLARAKGLSAKRIYFHHAFKNAVLPVVTIIGLSIPGLISGSVIFESIFAWPGMGRMAYMAVMNFDVPVVMGIGVMASFLTVFCTLITDILYTVLDPRIKMS